MVDPGLPELLFWFGEDWWSCVVHMWPYIMWSDQNPGPTITPLTGLFCCGLPEEGMTRDMGSQGRMGDSEVDQTSHLPQRIG